MNNDLSIRDEEYLLLELCRLEFSDEQLSRIRALKSGITDWNYFRNLANLHGVAALVCYNLEKHNLFPGIPEEITSYLRGTLMISLSRNTFFTGSIHDVLRMLNAEKIKTVILKGLALENSVYGSSGLRQMSDIDILTARNECMKARKILMSNGYESLPIKSPLHEMIITYFGKHLPPLIKNGTSVEIHHELFGDRKNLLTRMLYDSSYEVNIQGEKAWFPSPQIFFLYLIKHLWVHESNNESQLRLYADLIILLEHYRDEIINYDLLKYASEVGMTEILAWHLEPLRDMWGICFPGWVNELIDEWHIRDSDRFVFFLKSPKDNPPVDKAGFYRQIVREIPGIHRKVLYVLGDIFPSIGFMKNRYNCRSAWKVWIYYPHRLGKIMWLFGK
jgi:Uncharacterised nucleotidyltransferase